jgi:glycosyltransferase involved in cell wall biosynthesis
LDRSHGTERAFAELLERLAYEFHCEVHLFSQRVEDMSLSARPSRQQPQTGCIVWHRVAALPGPHLIQFVAWLVLNSWARMRYRISQDRPFDLILSPGINSLQADFVVVHALFHRLQDLSNETPNLNTVRRHPLRNLHRRAYYRLLVTLERRLYGRPTVFLVAVSHRTADLLSRSFGRQKIPVVPNGVDTAQFSPSARLARRTAARDFRRLSDSHALLLLIGNDWQNKGVFTVLKAMAQCSDLSLRFLIVGDDDPAPFLEQAHRLGLDSRCLWERSQRAVMDFYAAADLYVSPSREDSFGMPVLEAMACGLPVITSKFAGVAELISNGVDGFILEDPDDVRALSTVIRSIFRDPELRARCSQAAVATASKWTWNRNAAALWQLLQAKAKSRSNPSHGRRGRP